MTIEDVPWVTSQEINTAFLKLSRRAETRDPAQLRDTFVDAAPLLTLLSTRDHQIIYGRRGTGKTHALLYLGDTERRDGNIAVYLDMRTVGSTGGLYSDTDLPLSERGTRLLADTLGAVHEALLAFVVEHDSLDLSAIAPILDQFALAITEVSVTGTVEREGAEEMSSQDTDSSRLQIQIGQNSSALYESSAIDIQGSKNTVRYKEAGSFAAQNSF